MCMRADVYLLGNFVKAIALFQENGFSMDVNWGEDVRSYDNKQGFSPFLPGL